MSTEATPTGPKGPAPAGAWIGALRRSHERLAGLVGGLSPEQLTGPSFDTEWTVAQVLSHLGSGAEIMTVVLDVALAPDGAIDPSAFPPIWDVWNARPPAEQAARAVEADEANVARFEALTPDEIAASHVDFFGMPLDALGIVRMRLSEHALHRWDVAVSVDPDATVDPEAVGLLLDEQLTAIAARAGKPAGRPFEVDVHTTGPDRRFRLTVGDAVELRPVPPADPPAGPVPVLRLSAEALLLLVYGRLRTDRGARVDVPAGAGPLGLDDLRQVFPGF